MALNFDEIQLFGNNIWKSFGQGSSIFFMYFFSERCGNSVQSCITLFGCYVWHYFIKISTNCSASCPRVCCLLVFPCGDLFACFLFSHQFMLVLNKKLFRIIRKLFKKCYWNTGIQFEFRLKHRGKKPLPYHDMILHLFRSHDWWAAAGKSN